MPNEYARAVRELVHAKVEQRAPEVQIETTRGESPKVINIWKPSRRGCRPRVRRKSRKQSAKRWENPRQSDRQTSYDAPDKTIIAPHNALAFTGNRQTPNPFRRRDKAHPLDHALQSQAELTLSKT